MKTLIFIFIIITLSLSAKESFKKEQLKYPKVRKAIKEKEKLVKKLFKDKNIKYGSKIFIRVFKLDGKLEIWALKNKKYTLIKTYQICMPSGVIGPKRAQGDYQVPEGFYHLNHFNPYSSYYLSLGVSYPNKSDKILKSKRDAGGAIYIHGSCVTIGCMPLTDDMIKEVYIIAMESRNNHQYQIPVHIFPCKMDKKYCKKEMKKYPKNQTFWQNIEIGYKYFENNKVLPKIKINSKGKYIFK